MAPRGVRLQRGSDERPAERKRRRTTTPKRAGQAAPACAGRLPQSDGSVPSGRSRAAQGEIPVEGGNVEDPEAAQALTRIMEAEAALVRLATRALGATAATGLTGARANIVVMMR